MWKLATENQLLRRGLGGAICREAPAQGRPPPAAGRASMKQRGADVVDGRVGSSSEFENVLGAFQVRVCDRLDVVREVGASRCVNDGVNLSGEKLERPFRQTQEREPDVAPDQLCACT